ncbi:DMT(drug/metabolite transporter) superfamily permease [Oleiphilus messinensis]|uniref:DMT(Drug/metabolite transporter) superfamily permease n=1 Tax=Oleiphilus messinensis TaxID=141451 RepID=A0A1Y0I7W3_9GAMM|nr:DMT family transporter [Oleiphilus messinensis]ARU55585.1 DMT(drug/metabolite transporter) superfamily permease [Oleiphilus messinensis]
MRTLFADLEARRGGAATGVILMLLCVFVTACAGAMTKHIVDQVPVATIICIQYAVCLLFCLPHLLRHRQAVWKTQRLGTHIVRGIGGCLCFIFYYLAIENVPLVEAALLRSASPLCVPLVIWAISGKRIHRLHWIPIILGMCGVALILKPTSHEVSIWHLVGFMSALSLAVSMVFTRGLTFTEPGYRILFYYFLISVLFALPWMLYHWQPIPPETWPFLVGIGVSIYVALWLYTEAYRFAQASLISSFSYFGVVFAGILGWIFWKQLPDMISFAGIGLVVAGGILMLWIGERTSKQPSGVSNQRP